MRLVNRHLFFAMREIICLKAYDMLYLFARVSFSAFGELMENQVTNQDIVAKDET